MVKSARRVFLCSWVFKLRKDCFHSSQSSPPCQGLVGNLLRAEGWNYRLTIFSHAHLEFIPRFHQGVVLPCRKLWGWIHKMDHATVGKGPRRAGVHKYFPYPSHNVGYQGYGESFDTQILRLPAQVHSGRNTIPGHLLAWHNIPVCRQRLAEV